MTTNTIRWESNDDIVVLTLDDPDARVNTMTDRFVDDLEQTLDRLEQQLDDIAGVVLTSAKKTFFAGGNLKDLVTATRDDIEQFSLFVARNAGLLRRLETLGRPVVAAVNGSALGGGLELALATHHRVVANSSGLAIGLPEVTLGLLPGAGGVVRTVRMLGVQKALEEVLLSGRQLSADEALDLGLVHEVVSPDNLLEAAVSWIRSNPEAKQPWDEKGHRIPGGTPSDTRSPLATALPMLPAVLVKKLKGAPYPAPRAILCAAVESSQVPVDRAFEIESRYFVDLATSQISSNMIQALFFDMADVRGSRGRSPERTPHQASKVAILGAGMMGAGIAWDCARAGIEVILKDVTLESAERGKAYSVKLADRAVKKGRMSQQEADALLERITPTDEPKSAAGADLVIEAAFEDPAVKSVALQEIEPYLAEDALIGSNTSTLPISGLAEFVTDQSRFIGLHFFSPVDKMPLLEIIKGASTSEETLSRALDLAAQIGKTPIVVNDSRGFFTSRVIGTFVNEALAMLGEGVPAPTLERASSQAGYPAPVLQLTDELNMDLLRRVRDASRAAAEEAGGVWDAHPAEAVFEKMIELGRPSRLAGAGFYEYAEGRRLALWPGLAETFGGAESDAATMPIGDVVDRLLFVEAIEAVKCLDEGVLETIADANVGSILGIGYPSWTGGVLGFVDGYDGPLGSGTSGFVARARQLAERYGDRFAPPAILIEIADSGLSLAATRSPAAV